MNKKNNTFLIFNIILSIFFILLFLVYFFYFNKKSEDIEKYNQVILENDLENKELNALSLEYQKNKENIDKIKSFVLEPEGEVLFIEKIENLAKSKDLISSISSVSIMKDEGLTENNLEYLSLTINVSGSFKNVFEFFGLLESLPFKIVVNNAGFVYKNDGDKNISLWQGVFTIKVLKKNV